MKKQTNRYAVLDIETTGLSREYNQIAQIAIMIIDANGVELGNYNGYARIEAGKISKMLPLELKQNMIISNHCKSEKSILAEALKWLESYRVDKIITYNGRTFDLPFIQHRVLRYGLKRNIWNIEHIDVFKDMVPTAKKLGLYELDTLGRKGKQTYVAELMGVSTKGAHNAIDDIRMLKDIYFNLEHALEKAFQS